MPVCPQQLPELAALRNDPLHEQACFLDEETRAREAARLRESVKAGA
jgi:hypothetical protein